MTLSDELTPDAISVGAHAEDWRDAVRQAGALLTATGVTTDDYTDEMIATVEKLGPYIVLAPGIALAHSRPSPAVRRAGISWLQLAEPIEFGHEKNDPVWLVVALAALDHDGHIGLMSSLAAVLGDTELLDTLRDADSPARVLEILTTTGNEGPAS
ncbi:PTS sugar transporter subunit IIA [Aeromicrobium sp. 636]|uniref:Ascorbate-specific PTS system EIIA component n=1 Tax=Aeromicrobium senzhongii TaxID=2663859 RepID=A0A8I0K0P5_9ACTN|nr:MULTISPECIES: PTS sugar transporter subunit IIA [Aeromicrobium]MBC9226028.1 PTS sugar transporter subunit IIA [Aeromicrobium senzhongii]MCQ3998135.1 PTS sugar transporter subunit IIA [Aeromicrobium sp. 636]